MTATSEIRELQNEILASKKKLAELRKQNREEVTDYVLQTASGPHSLSSFFGDKRELVVIHNMGSGCNYCTLWADGFTGFTKHILTRAGMVLVSADDAATASAFAQQRGWNFPVASDADGAFRRAMLMDHEGDPMPGISAFTREDGKIYRHGYSPLGEGDDFCSIWHMWDLFPSGWNDWEPR